MRWLRNLSFRRPTHDDLAEEIREHIAERTEELIARGRSPEEAAKKARRAFGNTTLAHERSIEVWQWRWLENLWADLRYAVRLLRKSPIFTLTAVLTIAVGIGANTAVFSLLNGLLLRPLPVPHAQELVLFGTSQNGEPIQQFSAPVFRALENNHPAFSDIFAVSYSQMQIGEDGGHALVRTALVSGQFFSALQTAPLLGRYLSPADDPPISDKAPNNAVFAESYWRSTLHADPHIIGSRLLINHLPFTIVGVMPQRFRGSDPSERFQIFLPLAIEPRVDAPYDNSTNYNYWWLIVMGRRKSEVSLAQANASLSSVSASILKTADSSIDWVKTARSRHFQITVQAAAAGYNELRDHYAKPLEILLALCGCVLLLACLNLTSLLFARAASREHELATRLAIGATRWCLVQQLLLESFLLASIGAAAGALAAPFCAHALTLFLLNGADVSLDTSLDLRVLTLCVTAALLVVFLVGLAPALESTGSRLSTRLKTSAATSVTHTGTSFLSRVLHSFQVALALLLVIGAGLISTSLLRIYRTGAGFDPRGINLVTLHMDRQPLEGAPLIARYHALADAFAALPSVHGVSLVMAIPLTRAAQWVSFDRDGVTTPQIYTNLIAPHYFETMRIPLLAGRDFSWSDSPTSGKKMILSQAAAVALFPGQNAIGKTIDDNQIIGIVGNVAYNDLRDHPPLEGYFSIVQQKDKKPIYNFVVRLDGPPQLFADAVHDIVTRNIPQLPTPVFNTLGGLLDQSLAAERMMTLLAVFFAVCALLVTAIGLYGTLAYRTARRTSEIGIRIALGAQRTQVVALVFRQNVAVTIAGLVIGIIAASFATRILASFLYGTSPHDPFILALSALLLGFVAGAASLAPAIRAARIDPLIAIRTE